MKTGLLISVLLALASSCLAGTSEHTLNLAGYSPNLVRWLPTPRHDTYPQLVPPADRYAALEKLGYGSLSVDETHNLYLKRDQTVEETIADTWLYLTSSGIETNGNNGFWLDANHQRAEIEAAYVLQPDGTTVDVEPDTVQLNTDNSPNVFNDSVYVTIPFAQLKPGSIAVLRYKIISSRDKLPLPWSRNLYPVNFYPLERFRVEVRWDDASQKPAWRTDYPKLDCRESTEQLVCTSTEAAQPQPSDKQMPSPYDVLPVLTLAKPTTWLDISSILRSMTETALNKDNKLDAVVAELGAGTKDPQTLVGRLAQFVSREIRYVGLEHGHGSVIPRPTSSTLERRFGDCKDKTMLFVDLAKHAGLDAYPVLASTSRMSLDKLLLPATHYFNHMLACVKLPEQRETCLDLTDPDTSSEHLSFAVQGAVALTIGRGSDAPHNLATEPYTWVTRVKASNQLSEDGRIVETLERHYDSHWAAGLRRALTAKSKAEIDRWLVEDYRAIMGDKVNPSVDLRGLTQTDAELALNSLTEYRNAFNPKQISVYREIDPWLRNLTTNSKTLNSHYAYPFKGISYQSEIRYQLPAGKRINSVGAEIDYVSPWGAFHRYYRQDGASVTAYTDLQMPRTLIEVNDMNRFNRFLDLIGLETRLWFSLNAAEDQP